MENAKDRIDELDNNSPINLMLPFFLQVSCVTNLFITSVRIILYVDNKND